MSDVADSHAPKPQGDSTPPAIPPEPALAPLTAQAAIRDISRLQAIVCAVATALVVGFLAWGIGERTYGYYVIPSSAQSGRDISALAREGRIVDQKNTAVAFGTFGALMGLLSGVTGGLLRRSMWGGATGALAGMLLGGIGAALVSYELIPIFDRFYSDESASLLVSFGFRGAIWMVIGMTAGLALGWGWQGPRGIPRGLTGGLVGAACGTIVFEVVNAVLFPADRDDAVIPSSMQARLLAYLFVSFGVAIGAVLVGRPRSWPAGRKLQSHAKPIISLE
jgi:hypothetical protein